VKQKEVGNIQMSQLGHFNPPSTIGIWIGLLGAIPTALDAIPHKASDGISDNARQSRTEVIAEVGPSEEAPRVYTNQSACCAGDCYIKPSAKTTCWTSR
jgi:hypothetical protein